MYNTNGNKTKVLFCVASPNLESTKEIKIVDVKNKEDLLQNVYTRLEWYQ